MTIKAFPVKDIIERDSSGNYVGREVSQTGMDLRDYFAAKAMQAIYPSDYDYNITAIMAYEMADAMIKARG